MGDLCDNIGLVGVSAKWSYVTASPSHHDQAIPILSPLLFMHVGHPYIPLFKIHLIYLSRILFYSLTHFPFPFSTLISPLYSRRQKNVSRIVHLCAVLFNLHGETMQRQMVSGVSPFLNDVHRFRAPFYKLFTDVALSRHL